MIQSTLGSSGFELHAKKTRKRVFLEEMQSVVPWAALVDLIEPHYAKSGKHGGAKGGRPSFAIETMLKIHFMQQWFGLSDPAIEEALHDVALYRGFAGLDIGADRMPDETTILRFRHLLEEHDLSEQMFAKVNAGLRQRGLLLKEGTVVDATLIAAPSSTKNKDGERDPEMHQTKKGGNYYFGMKAHIGVDAESGLVHTVEATPANVHDVTKAVDLLHGEETTMYGDAGYQGVAKREEFQEAHPTVECHTALRPSKRRALDTNTPLGAVLEKIEGLKASVRAKVEHPFQIIKCQWGYRKTRYKGLAKNAQQLVTLFMLSNLHKVRRVLKQMMIPLGLVRPTFA
jgi:transposase, IS5 family